MICAPENKYIFYSFFLGIDFKELVNIKRKDVNIEKKTVHLITGRILNVDKLWIELMIKTDESESYKEFGEEYNKDRDDLTRYVESEYVLKKTIRYDNAPLTSNLIQTRMRTIQSQIDNKLLTQRTIYVNGLVHYIKDKYNAKGISLKSAILDMASTKRSMYNSETENYIEEFSSNMTARALKKEIGEHIDCFED
jgi:hypothetical protein